MARWLSTGIPIVLAVGLLRCSGSTDSSAPPVPVSTVVVAPSLDTVFVGSKVTLTAVVKDATGNPLTGRSVHWSSSAPGVASVNTQGVVAGLAAGAAYITAASEGRSGSAVVTVMPVPVAAVTVAPAVDTVVVGVIAGFAAAARDSNGTALPGRPMSWSSSDPNIATVSQQGQAIGVHPGTAVLTAASGGRSGSATLVVLAPVARLLVTPDTATVQLNGTVQYSAAAYDAGGNPLLGRPVAWFSADGSVASVTAAGLATGTGPGTTFIVASSGVITDSARIAVPLPISGTPVPSLAVFDSTIVSFMLARHIPAGTLAVMKDGVMVLSHGYGWMDQNRTQVVAPGAVFRLASVTKPMTGAAIRRLIAQGLLADTTRVFQLLGLTPLPVGAAVADPRIFDITIQHLLDHEGGWAAPGSLVDVRAVAATLGLARPATAVETARWMMTQPLQFAPGTNSSYSNFGYALLGLVVEHITGQAFATYIKQSVVPAAAGEIIEAQDLPPNRDPREPRYSDPGVACSVYSIAVCVRVPAPDGGLAYQSFRAAGGLAASAPGVLTFLDQYWIDGRPRPPGEVGYWYLFFGSLPGTFTVAKQRFDRVNIVALFDQRTDPSGLLYDTIDGLLDQTADGIVQWP